MIILVLLTLGIIFWMLSLFVTVSSVKSVRPIMLDEKRLKLGFQVVACSTVLLILAVIIAAITLWLGK